MKRLQGVHMKNDLIPVEALNEMKIEHISTERVCEELCDTIQLWKKRVPNKVQNLTLRELLLNVQWPLLCLWLLRLILYYDIEAKEKRQSNAEVSFQKSSQNWRFHRLFLATFTICATKWCSLHISIPRNHIYSHLRTTYLSLIGAHIKKKI